MGNIEKKYLVLVQIDSIQNYLFDFLSKSENKMTLATAQKNSLKISSTSMLKEIENENLINFNKNLFDNNLSEEEIIINVSGKCLVKICESKKKKLDCNIKKYMDDNPTLILQYCFQEIQKEEKEEYDELMIKAKSFKKINYTLLNTDRAVLKKLENNNNNEETQTTKKTLKNFCVNDSNQIAIIKVDLNNIGNYFKNINYEDLKNKSKKFDELIEGFKLYEEDKIYSLYVSGDDIFIISSLDYVKKVLEDIELSLCEMNRELFLNNENKITAGIAVLTTDYRSTFRYYLEHVEELLVKVKKDKSKNNVSINGMELELRDAIRFFEFPNGVNEISKSKLHNVLSILKSNSELKKLDAMYILSKEKSSTYAEIFNKISESNFEDKEEIKQIIYYIQNIILFATIDFGRIVEYKFEISKDYKKDAEDTTEFTVPKIYKSISLQLYNKMYDVEHSGFWFNLNKLIGEGNIEKYLLNYQYQNKYIIYFDFKDEMDKNNENINRKKYIEGDTTKDKEIRKKVNDYKQCVEKETKDKKQEYVKKLAEKIRKYPMKYQKLCREMIIYLNLKEKESN